MDVGEDWNSSEQISAWIKMRLCVFEFLLGTRNSFSLHPSRTMTSCLRTGQTAISSGNEERCSGINLLGFNVSMQTWDISMTQFLTEFIETERSTEKLTLFLLLFIHAFNSCYMLNFACDLWSYNLFSFHTAISENSKCVHVSPI